MTLCFWAVLGIADCPQLENLNITSLVAYHTFKTDYLLFDFDMSDLDNLFDTLIFLKQDLLIQKGEWDSDNIEDSYNKLLTYKFTNEELEFIESRVCRGVIDKNPTNRLGFFYYFNISNPIWDSHPKEKEMAIGFNRGIDEVFCRGFKSKESKLEILGDKGFFPPLLSREDDEIKTQFNPNLFGKQFELLPEHMQLVKFIAVSKSSIGNTEDAQPKTISGGSLKSESSDEEEESSALGIRKKNKEERKLADGNNRILTYIECERILQEAHTENNNTEPFIPFYDDNNPIRLKAIEKCKPLFISAFDVIGDLNPDISTNEYLRIAMGNGAIFKCKRDLSLNEYNGKFLSALPLMGMRQAYRYEDTPKSSNLDFKTDSIHDSPYLKHLFSEECLGKTFFKAWTTERFDSGHMINQLKYRYDAHCEDISIPFICHPDGEIYSLVIDINKDRTFTIEHTKGIVKQHDDKKLTSDQFQLHIRNISLDPKYKIDTLSLKRASLYAEVVNNPYIKPGLVKGKDSTKYNIARPTPNSDIVKLGATPKDTSPPIHIYRGIELLFAYATVGYEREEDGSLSADNLLDLFENNLKEGNPVIYHQVLLVLNKFFHPYNSVMPVYIGEKRIGKDSFWVELLKYIFRGFGGGVHQARTIQQIFDKHAADIPEYIFVVINDEKSSPIEAGKNSDRLKSFTGSNEIRIDGKFKQPCSIPNNCTLAATTNTPPPYLEGAKRKMEVLMVGGMKRNRHGLWIKDNRKFEYHPCVKDARFTEDGITYKDVRAYQLISEEEVPSFLYRMTKALNPRDNLIPPGEFVELEVDKSINERKTSSMGPYAAFSSNIASYQASANESNKESYFNQIVKRLENHILSNKRTDYVRWFMYHDKADDSQIGSEKIPDYGCLFYDAITVELLIHAIKRINRKEDGDGKNYTESIYERHLTDEGVNFDTDDNGDVDYHEGSKSVTIEGIAQKLLIDSGIFTAEDYKLLSERYDAKEKVDTSEISDKSNAVKTNRRKLAAYKAKPVSAIGNISNA